MKLQAMQCPNCKAPVEPIEDSRFMFCPYCGTKIVIDDIEYYREDAKTKRKRLETDAEIRKAEVAHNAEIEKERIKHKGDGNDMKWAVIMLGMCFLMLAFLFILGFAMG